MWVQTNNNDSNSNNDNSNDNNLAFKGAIQDFFSLFIAP